MRDAQEERERVVEWLRKTRRACLDKAAEHCSNGHSDAAHDANTAGFAIWTIINAIERGDHRK